MSSSDQEAESIRLSDGKTMPVIGLGTYLCNTEEAYSCCSYALSIGYRCIDTAEFYNNHEGIARAMKESGIPRESIYLVDKLNPGGLFGAPTKTYEETVESLHRHLKRLETSYIDLYLIHHAYAKDGRINQYRALVDMQSQGYIRSIGVSNWNESHIEEIRAAGLPLPVANQIEIHPLCTQASLIPYLRANSIVPVAYSSLAPLSSWRVGQGSAKTGSEADNVLEPIIQALAKKYSVSESQILLKWALQQGYPILPKSLKEDRISANRNLFSFALSEEDVKSLGDCDEDRPFAWPIGNPLNAE